MAVIPGTESAECRRGSTVPSVFHIELRRAGEDFAGGVIPGRGTFSLDRRADESSGHGS